MNFDSWTIWRCLLKMTGYVEDVDLSDLELDDGDAPPQVVARNNVLELKIDGHNYRVIELSCVKTRELSMRK